MNTFNENLAINRKNRIASNLSNYNFLRKELCFRTAERLDEIRYNFDICLDIGASLGEFYEQAHNKLGKIIQIDNSAEILKFNKYESKVLSSYYNLPFETNSMNLVVAILALDKSNNPKDIIKKIFQILKKGGLFILVNPIIGTLDNLQQILAETEIKMFNSYSQRIHPFSDIKTISNTLFSNGFSDIVADADKIEIMYKNPKDLFVDLKNTANNNCVTQRNPKYLGKQFWNEVYKTMEEYKDKESNCYPVEFRYCTIMGWKS